ncbi:MAG: ImmA/IrrE family metallo-endopeptidase [Rectinema sp.]
MDDFCPPFLEVCEIKKKVEDFRSRFSRCNIFPIDMEALLEQDLRISIQPIKRLRSAILTDAFISSDFRTLYVDEYEYMNDYFQNKLRFSFAHEISHLVLHAELYRHQDFNDIESYIDFQMAKSEKAYSQYEKQANIFSTNLLIPTNELRKVLAQKKDHLKSSGDPLIRIRPEEYLNDLVKREAADYFGVSDDQTLSYFIANEKIIF